MFKTPNPGSFHSALTASLVNGRFRGTKELRHG